VTASDLEARRARSTALFNNRHFAECAAHLLQVSGLGAEFVTVRKIAATSGLADSVVRPIILRLTDAGALERLPRLGGTRSPQYYRLVDTTLLTWVALREVVDEPAD
jgi:hypothetical protein